MYVPHKHTGVTVHACTSNVSMHNPKQTCATINAMQSHACTQVHACPCIHHCTHTYNSACVHTLHIYTHLCYICSHSHIHINTQAGISVQSHRNGSLPFSLFSFTVVKKITQSFQDQPSPAQMDRRSSPRALGNYFYPVGGLRFWRIMLPGLFYH